MSANIRPQQQQSKKPFVAKGHDAILKNAQDNRSLVNVFFIDGEMAAGTIVSRDRYTLTIRLDEDDQEVTFYKHALKGFAVLKQGN